MSRIVEWVLAHGGIRRIHTHPCWATERSTGRRVRRWANTIVCHDGACRQLTTHDEQALKALPEPMRAEEHTVEEG